MHNDQNRLHINVNNVPG